MTSTITYYSQNREQMHAADIKAGLQKAGVKMREIAQELEISETTVSQVIYGRSSSYRVAKRIASHLNKSVNDIWPGRYENKKRS